MFLDSHARLNALWTNELPLRRDVAHRNTHSLSHSLDLRCRRRLPLSPFGFLFCLFSIKIKQSNYECVHVPVRLTTLWECVCVCVCVGNIWMEDVGATAHNEKCREQQFVKNDSNEVPSKERNGWRWIQHQTKQNKIRRNTIGTEVGGT